MGTRRVFSVKRSPRFAVARHRLDLGLLSACGTCVHVGEAHVPVVEVDEAPEGDGRLLVSRVPRVRCLGAHVVVEPVEAVVGDVRCAED